MVGWLDQLTSFTTPNGLEFISFHFFNLQLILSYLLSLFVEVTLGAYTLLRGMDTTHWIAAGREIPNAAKRIGVSYYVDRDFVAHYIRQDLNFCIIQLNAPVGSGFMPLPRGDPPKV